MQPEATRKKVSSEEVAQWDWHMGLCVAEYPWFGKVQPMVGNVDQVMESKQISSFLL